MKIGDVVRLVNVQGHPLENELVEIIYISSTNTYTFGLLGSANLQMQIRKDNLRSILLCPNYLR